MRCCAVLGWAVLCCPTSDKYLHTELRTYMHALYGGVMILALMTIPSPEQERSPGRRGQRKQNEGL